MRTAWRAWRSSVRRWRPHLQAHARPPSGAPKRRSDAEETSSTAKSPTGSRAETQLPEAESSNPRSDPAGARYGRCAGLSGPGAQVGSRGRVRALWMEDERLNRKALDFSVDAADEGPHLPPGDALDGLAELAHRRVLEQAAEVA